MKSKTYKALIPIIVIAVVIVGLDFIARYTANSFQKREEEVAAFEEELLAALNPTSAPLDTSVDWRSFYEEKGVDVIPVGADTLFTDHEDYAGNYVLTVFPVKSAADDMLKASTESNHSIYFSIVCSFDNPAEIAAYKKGDVVAVIGKASDENFTVTLSDCHVIAAGEEAEALGL